MRVGLVSDTHGRFEPRLRRLFRGCDLILHAGDIVTPDTLGELGALAPVRAVRGNNDLGPAFDVLPEIAVVPLGALTAVVVHRIGARARLDPPVRRAVARSAASLLVYGHSHRPSLTVEDGLLRVNPGSAGPRRFSLPRSAGVVEIDGARAVVCLFDVSSDRLPVLQGPVRLDGPGAAPVP